MGIKGLFYFRAKPVYFFVALQLIISLFLGHKFFIHAYQPIGDEIDYVSHMNAMLERLEVNGFVADSFNINVDRLPGFPAYLAAIKWTFSALKISDFFYHGIFIINLLYSLAASKNELILMHLEIIQLYLCLL